MLRCIHQRHGCTDVSSYAALLDVSAANTTNDEWYRDLVLEKGVPNDNIREPKVGKLLCLMICDLSKVTGFYITLKMDWVLKVPLRAVRERVLVPWHCGQLVLCCLRRLPRIPLARHTDALYNCTDSSCCRFGPYGSDDLPNKLLAVLHSPVHCLSYCANISGKGSKHRSAF